MAKPPAKARLGDLLTRPLPDAARLVLSHRRRRSFRWLALLELPIKLVFLVLLLVVIIIVSVIMMVSGEGGRTSGPGDEGSALPGLSIRFFEYWHELVLVVFDKDGAKLHEVSVAPPAADEAEGIVAAVLAAADRQGLVVVETLGAKMSETLEVWYGGQPLMAHPEQRDAEVAANILRESGFELRAVDDGVEIVEQDAERSRFVAAILMLLALGVLPLGIWFGGYRRSLGSLWLDLRGVGPQRRILEISREGRLSLRDERGSRKEQLVTIDGREMVGIAFSATLGHDRDVTRRPPSLRLVTQNETHTLPYGLQPPVGRALRDYLVAKALEFWEGIPIIELRPTRCPYCAALYTFDPGKGCPACGGWPDKVDGST